MTENEVNIKVKEWLEANGWHYKGVLAKGHIPVPDGLETTILIDHQGVKHDNISKFYGNQSDPSLPHLIWVEAKGNNVALSELLEAFIRVCYAIHYGGGTGLIAAPHNQIKMLLERREFLSEVSSAVFRWGRIGLLDAETLEEMRLG